MADEDEMSHDPFDDVLAGWARAMPGVNLTSVSLSVRIGRLASIFNRGMDDLVRPYGFGYGELEVLFFLLNAGKPYEIRPIDLTRGCFVTSGAITGRVDRLARLGLVTRIPSLVDRREMMVRLSRDGEKIARRLQVKVACESALTIALARLPEDRRSGLDDALRELHVQLEAVLAEERDLTSQKTSQKIS